MKSAIVVFPGLNRERDMARALRLVTGAEPVMVWHADSELPPADLVVIPGGLLLGVCNGFQILCEAGLLPGVLMRNAQLKFICRDAYLRIERSDTPFTRGYNAGQV